MEGTPEDVGQMYERLVDELLDSFSDEQLGGGATGPRVLFRINAEGFSEAALIFDPETGARQRLRVPIAGGEAA